MKRHALQSNSSADSGNTYSKRIYARVMYGGTEMDVETNRGRKDGERRIKTQDVCDQFGLPDGYAARATLHYYVENERKLALRNRGRTEFVLPYNWKEITFSLVAPGSGLTGEPKQAEEQQASISHALQPSVLLSDEVVERLKVNFQDLVLHYYLKWDKHQGLWIKGATKLCATIVDKNWAITAAHCLNKTVDETSEDYGHYYPLHQPLELYDEAGKSYTVTVEMIDRRPGYDFAWLKITEGKEFTHQPDAVEPPSITDNLIYMLGKQTLKLCALPGSVLSVLNTGRLFVPSPGSSLSFSGGGAFYANTSRILVGIVIGGPKLRYEGKYLQDKEFHKTFASHVIQPSQCFILNVGVAVEIRNERLSC